MTIIEVVTEVFEAEGKAPWLIKSAYTGIAASLVRGKTTHVISLLSVNSRQPMTEETKAKLRRLWAKVRYLIIDEMSMISKSFLAKLSRNIGIGMEGNNYRDMSSSFGGVNVILCGDFHQFPPVATKHGEALYYEQQPGLDDTDAKIGRKIYEEFETVVILREQKRVDDPVWRSFLSRLRQGKVDDEGVDMLKGLVLSKGQKRINVDEPQWRTAPLITP